MKSHRRVVDHPEVAAMERRLIKSHNTIEAHLHALYRTGTIQMLIRSTASGLRTLSQVFAFRLFTPSCVKHPSHEKDQELAATRHTFHRH